MTNKEALACPAGTLLFVSTVEYFDELECKILAYTKVNCTVLESERCTLCSGVEAGYATHVQMDDRISGMRSSRLYINRIDALIDLERKIAQEKTLCRRAIVSLSKQLKQARSISREVDMEHNKIKKEMEG